MMFPIIPSAQTIILSCIKLGIAHVVISPGSRNAPLAIGFASNKKFKCFSIIDERSAGFFALGIAQQTKRPAVLLCTSGSALLNYSPSIAEAFYSEIPLIVISADRPLYKINIGDGQTINQLNVFGKNILSSDSLMQDVSHQTSSISKSNRQKLIKTPINRKEINKLQLDIQRYNEELLRKRFHECIQLNKPVHLNIPLEEPLYDFLEKPTISLSKKHKRSYSVLQKGANYDFNVLNKHSKIIILIGCCQPNYLTKKTIDNIKSYSNIVVLKESTSNIEDDSFFGNIDKIIAPIELLKNSYEIFDSLSPNLLITIGGMIISKKIKSFLRDFPPKIHLHVGLNKANDTYYKGVKHILKDPNLFFEKAPFIKNSESGYYNSWKKISNQRMTPHKDFLKKAPFSDLIVFSIISSSIPSSYQVQVANSSPIRYLQLFKLLSSNKTYCNRGTSGIDGSTSTAVGASVASSSPMLLITGDLSFFYDINGLWNNYIKSSFRIIIINNGGGGIFRILPGHKDNEIFSKFIENNHSLNAKELAKLYGFSYQNTKSKYGVKTTLKTFFKKSLKPKILEISTPSAISSKTLKNYFEYLSKN